jgi:hypothetical protein
MLLRTRRDCREGATKQVEANRGERTKTRYRPPVRAIRVNEAVLVTAARLRFGMNVKSLVRAAVRDGGR